MLKTVVDVILISPHPGQTLCKASHLWEPLGNKAEVLPALGIHNGPRGWTATLQGGSGSPWAPWIPGNKRRPPKREKQRLSIQSLLCKGVSHRYLNFGGDPMTDRGVGRLTCALMEAVGTRMLEAAG